MIAASVRGPIFNYLYSDLFRRVDDHGLDVDPERTMVLRGPLGWMVLLTERQDGAGYAGEVRSADGSRVSTTSWLDVPWLEEHLP